MYRKIKSDFYPLKGFLVGELNQRLNRLLVEGEAIVGLYYSIGAVVVFTDKRVILMNDETEEIDCVAEFFSYKSITTVRYAHNPQYPSIIVSVNIDQVHLLRFVCDSTDDAENFTKMIFGFMAK